MKHREYELQKSLCYYLESQYKDVLFVSDTIGNIKLTMGQAVRNKAIQKQGFKTPDLLILEPNSRYSGLFIEIKNTFDDVFTKREKKLKNDHVKAQYESILRLREKGYFACFGIGLDDCIEIIDNYMNIE